MKLAQLITSRDNPFFKRLARLARSAHQRKIAGLTLLDGVHLIETYLPIGQPESLIVSETGCNDPEIQRLMAEAVCGTGGTGSTGAKAAITMLSDALFRDISSVQTPTGIMASIPIPSPGSVRVRRRNDHEEFWVLLEAIQDPGNFGSILRSAAAAGASSVYLSHGCADPWSPKALRAGMGAHFLLPIYERSNLAEMARIFKGKVIASMPDAKKDLYQTGLTGPVAFVFGNEGAGLSEALLQACVERIRIPMTGDTESLNVAAAAAVFFFERVRQRKADGPE
jgi:TrmH family RNA methyltransferase